jgi:hypothetical protein
MTKTGNFCLVIGFLFAVDCGSAQTIDKSKFSALRGPYLGQKTPHNAAEMFAPGLVSTGLYERDCTVSPDGKEIYYGVFIGGWATIMLTRNIDGAWTEPAILPFASDPEFNFVEPCLSPDGKKLLFLSTLPPAGEKPKRGWGHQNIWVVDRQGDGSWGKPYDLGQPINTPDQEYFPSLTRDGTLYFSRASAGAPSAVYRSRLVNNGYSSPEKLPSPVNGSWSIYNACIAPDESYLVGCVSGKDTTLPKNVSRYCVSFRSHDGSWSELMDMGEMINPPGSTALSPSISPDGKYFFFSLSQPIPMASLKELKNHSDILKVHAGPFNGSANVHWVSTEIIDDIRRKK